MSKIIDQLYDKVISVLDKKLPPYITYHSLEHTKYVFEKASHIAKKEGVSKKNFQLVQVAALYHDIGYTKTHIEHEKEGCKIAKRQLPKFGFSKKDIDKICGMIMSTRLPQSPITILDKILCDADLEYLATNKFEEIGEYLYKEIRHFNPSLNRKKWNEIQINFLSSHRYHTDYCKRYKEHRKRRNLANLMG